MTHLGKVWEAWGAGSHRSIDPPASRMVSIMPMIEFDDLLACLQIESSADDRYRLPNLKMPYQRILGGQLFAQESLIRPSSG